MSTTMEIHTPDGQTSEPFTLDDLDAAHERLKAQRQGQLSFFVGGASPNVSVIQLSGKLGCRKQIAKGSELRVQIIDADGEVIAEEDALVAAISFTDKRDEDGNVVQTIRAHHTKI